MLNCFNELVQNILNLLWKHLGKLEMDLTNMEYPKWFFRYVIFFIDKNDLKGLEMIWKWHFYGKENTIT